MPGLERWQILGQALGSSFGPTPLPLRRLKTLILALGFTLTAIEWLPGQVVTNKLFKNFWPLWLFQSEIKEAKIYISSMVRSHFLWKIPLEMKKNTKVCQSTKINEISNRIKHLMKFCFHFHFVPLSNNIFNRTSSYIDLSYFWWCCVTIRL